MNKEMVVEDIQKLVRGEYRTMIFITVDKEGNTRMRNHIDRPGDSALASILLTKMTIDGLKLIEEVATTKEKVEEKNVQ